MKQETLEEAAEKYATNHGMMAYVFPEKEKSFIDGAKWQQQNSYSEEDMKEALPDVWVERDGKLTFSKAIKKWFEEFKKP